MKTLSERLKVALEAAKMSQEQLAQRVGISQPAIAKLVSGKAKSSRKSLEIALALGVNPTWLVSGKGEIANPNSHPFEEWENIQRWDEPAPLELDEVEVPFLTDIDYVYGNGEYSKPDYKGFKLRFSKPTFRRVGADPDGKGVLCFPAKGDSMAPLIPNDATVAINCDNKKVIDGKVYAINQNGWKRIKILIRSSHDKITIRSLKKEEYPDEEVSMDSVEILGKVFWVASFLD
ncbi:XRE family transcriptional regulator [Xenorhabdus indica]|uniref:XRE family transcriptional regulator n=1 Tax=Xenorhabdus indica TaxID=333964 RepID=UPI00165728BA|nr:helix-turn-helix transcriptional regulator [Xenorhabdus indica]MBC8946923.1 repressor [Xenorhabdus indica]